MDCWWSVWVEHRGEDPNLVTDEALGELVNALAPNSGIVTGGSGHATWGARISVQAATAVQAVTRATAIVAWSAAKTGLPDWPVVHAEATRADLLDAEPAPQR